MQLILTLGHNSSAILVEDGQVLGGYEEERLTAIKSDSRFPVHAIAAACAEINPRDITDVYVGHWFLDANLPGQPNKYWDKGVIDHFMPNAEIHSLTTDFTHHDSHLESAMVFAGREFTKDCSAIIADGFGSFGECISFYEIENNSYRLIKRVFGFDRSLGMLYQYATAFMGMKMHNHEYKMLAYEVHLHNYEMDLAQLHELIKKTSDSYIKSMIYDGLSNLHMDPVVTLDALPNVQLHINNMLTNVLNKMDVDYNDTHTMRCVISYFVQHVVEEVMMTLAAIFTSKANLLLAGGLFYNVKLNSLLAKTRLGKTCIMPLAGDQGAGLGVYQAYCGNLKWPGHLAWGRRELSQMAEMDLPPGVVLAENMEEATHIMRKELGSLGFVNLVRGNLEFGPRALCNTSTIGLPTADVAMEINRINARTMEMPFAPVVTAEKANELFEGVDQIHESLGYMIVTRDYKPGVGEKVAGAAHYYPDQKVYTGRPQITTDPALCQLLSENDGLLINTSFNYHGVPIVCTNEQILDTHISQRRTAPDVKALTIIVKD